jgi:hypothetical protein
MNSNDQLPSDALSNASRPKAFAVMFVIALALTTCLTQSVEAQSYRVLYSFTGGTDGSAPEAGLTWDSAGNLYGTARSGGQTGPNCGNNYGCGAVFKLTPAGSGWTFSMIYSFAGGLDGDTPVGRVVFGSDGNLYGTTAYGGFSRPGDICAWGSLTGCGTVFSLSPPADRISPDSWNKVVLYRFAFGMSALKAQDGANPTGDLVFDQEGNIYGTTTGGGACGGIGCGTVYELRSVHGSWVESVLHAFGTGGKGIMPLGGVIFDGAGDLYGTAAAGGQYSDGTVFQLVPTSNGWNINVLYAFQGQYDGESPQAGLIIDASGNLYGTTEWGQGGAAGGTVFELSPSGGGWTYHLLYTFTDRGGPTASLALDAAGNLYGTTRDGGIYGAGNVFKLTRSYSGWTYTSLYDFTGGSDGAIPFSNLIFDLYGNIYGTAASGGSGCYGGGCGVVFEITP